MTIYSEKTGWGKKFLVSISVILFAWTGVVVASAMRTSFSSSPLSRQGRDSVFEAGHQGATAELGIMQGNSILPIVQPRNPEPKAVRTIKVLVTGYSSTPEETDDTPFITAAGTRVREGIVANNFLRMGTKIRIPEIYGDRVFVVEDRMNPTKGKNLIDVWFSSRRDALNFGAKRTYIEVLEG